MAKSKQTSHIIDYRHPSPRRSVERDVQSKVPVSGTDEAACRCLDHPSEHNGNNAITSPSASVSRPVKLLLQDARILLDYVEGTHAMLWCWEERLVWSRTYIGAIWHSIKTRARGIWSTWSNTRTWLPKDFQGCGQMCAIECARLAMVGAWWCIIVSGWKRNYFTTSITTNSCQLRCKSLCIPDACEAQDCTLRCPCFVFTPHILRGFGECQSHSASSSANALGGPKLPHVGSSYVRVQTDPHATPQESPKTSMECPLRPSQKVHRTPWNAFLDLLWPTLAAWGGLGKPWVQNDPHDRTPWFEEPRTTPMRPSQKVHKPSWQVLLGATFLLLEMGLAPTTWNPESTPVTKRRPSAQTIHSSHRGGQCSDQAPCHAGPMRRPSAQIHGSHQVPRLPRTTAWAPRHPMTVTKRRACHAKPPRRPRRVWWYRVDKLNGAEFDREKLLDMNLVERSW